MTRKGTRVPARCVRSTTHHVESSEEFKKKSNLRMTRRLRLHIPSIRSVQKKDCPPGMIPRKAYVRRYTTAVKERGFTVKRSGQRYRVRPTAQNIVVESKCIPDLGLPGKGSRSGRGIGPLHEGELHKYGYSYKYVATRRQAALRKAAREYGPLGVYRKLDAVAKLTMRTLPELSRVLAEDRDWVRKTMGPLKAFQPQ